MQKVCPPIQPFYAFEFATQGCDYPSLPFISYSHANRIHKSVALCEPWGFVPLALHNKPKGWFSPWITPGF